MQQAHLIDDKWVQVTQPRAAIQQPDTDEECRFTEKQYSDILCISEVWTVL